MSTRYRESKVVVGLFRNQGGGYLIRYNRRWRGYVLPMTKLHTTDSTKESAAIRAVEEALGRTLENPQAEALAYFEFISDYSPSHDDWPAKEFYVYEVRECRQNGESRVTEEANGRIGDAVGFVDQDSLDPQRLRSLITESSRRVFHTLMHNQQVSVAVVSRNEGREVLLIWHDGYQGFFFPAARRTSDLGPASLAEQALRREADYQPRQALSAEFRDRVPDVHFSHRLNQERTYAFDICQVVVPDLEELGAALDRTGRPWKWVNVDHLRNAQDLSPTVESLRLAVVAAAKPAQ